MDAQKDLTKKAGLAVQAAVLAFFFLSISANALSDEVEFKIDQVEKQAAAMGEPIMIELAAFRKDVETNAKVDTLKLCEGYRRVRGMGPAKYHGKYVYSFEQSSEAWAKIFQEGLMQPLSSVGGLKSAYLRLNHYRMLEFETWFRSLYSLYLIHSMGFLEGAMHCLNTMNKREINTFASAIVIADLESSLATHVGLTWTGGYAISALIKITGYILWPARYLMNALNIRLSKTHVMWGAVITVPILTDNLFQYFEKMAKAKSLVEEAMDSESPLSQESQRSRRILAITTALRIFIKEEDANSKDFPEFHQFIKENITKSNLLKAKQDLSNLVLSQNSSDEDQKYKIVLEVILPILENIQLK